MVPDSVSFFAWAQFALQFLLIPIVTKLWSLDVRLAKVETMLKKEGD